MDIRSEIRGSGLTDWFGDPSSGHFNFGKPQFETCVFFHAPHPDAVPFLYGTESSQSLLSVRARVSVPKSKCLINES
jgi:hypothetical protein